jgi:hypothetical protein
VEALKKMPGHTRLYRRGATYYHRAAVPQDIRDTYGKREETFSLGTTDHAEACRLVREAAVNVDRKLEARRASLRARRRRPVTELTPEQVELVKSAYYRARLEEDDEVRLEGFDEFETNEEGEAQLVEIPDLPRRTFEAAEQLHGDMLGVTRHSYARGKSDEFFRVEAEDVFHWDGIGIRLDPRSRSWPQLIRAVQEAGIEAGEAISQRSAGEAVKTPDAPQGAAGSLSSSAKMSNALEVWVEEKLRTESWTPKAAADCVAAATCVSSKVRIGSMSAPRTHPSPVPPMPDFRQNPGGLGLRSAPEMHSIGERPVRCRSPLPNSSCWNSSTGPGSTRTPRRAGTGSI